MQRVRICVNDQVQVSEFTIFSDKETESEEKESLQREIKEVFETFLSHFNGKDKKILTLFTPDAIFQVIDQKLHTLHETIRALSTHFSKFVIPMDLNHRVQILINR